MTEADVRVTRYTIGRLPETIPDHYVWEINVEYAGDGRWAVRHLSQYLDHNGKWDYKPSDPLQNLGWPSEHAWSDATEAIQAAFEAEPHVKVNGLTSRDVLNKSSGRPNRSH